MCGTSLPVIPDEFKVGEALDKDHKELTEQQTAEMESLAPLGEWDEAERGGERLE
ncbi:hypothetical protein DPMN_036653 [Dreissena polymorpha]|uniref:Uncharacterized protein n=1 Tax=Dreissena polymorpha TaxID=45954 RepID=A0A9D4RNB4_DREPO|nr:hypothetical protein DPMN_036653 [Dreissena polymorpha]